VKQIFDVAVALTLLVLLSPLLMLLGILAWISTGAPLFIQVRPGLHGEPFSMVKFSTMTRARGADGVSLGDDRRLTRLGRVMRRYSLDELPELWNVLRGQMSLVGPRPLLMDYLALYTPEQARRHDVRPGITGWAQVSGRNLIPWAERFRLDVWYVDNQSIGLDARILWMTVWSVIGGKGVNEPGHASMTRFTGIGGSAGLTSEKDKESSQ